MHEIALTRYHVADGSELAPMLRVSLLNHLRSPGNRRAFVRQGLLLGVLGALVRDSDADVLDSVTTGLVTGFAGSTLMVLLRAVRAYEVLRRRFAIEVVPGTVTRAGVVPGFVRLSGPDNDIVSVFPSWTPIAYADGTALVGGNGGWILPESLLPPYDVERALAEPRGTALPTRAGGGDPALTHELVVDGDYARVAARASMTHRLRTPAWWCQVMATAAGLVGLAALVTDRSLGTATWLGGAALAVVAVLARLCWLAWKIGLDEHGGRDGSGVRVRIGFGPTSFRQAWDDYDVVRPYDGVRRVRVLPEVVQLLLRDREFVTLPHHVVDPDALDLLRRRGSATSDGR